MIISFSTLFLFFKLPFLKSNNKKLSDYLIIIFRFLIVFIIVILIINPTFKTKNKTKEKPIIILAIDNSKSIKKHIKKKNLQNKIDSIENRLEKNYNIKKVYFGETITFDSLTLKSKLTNFSVLKDFLSRSITEKVSAVIIISDGNYNFGRNIIDDNENFKIKVHTVLVGSYVKHPDIKIYSVYNKSKISIGNNTIFSLVVGGQNIETETEVDIKVFENKKLIKFDKVLLAPNSLIKKLSYTVSPPKKGINKYKVEISQHKFNEKNKFNNVKNFEIETGIQVFNIGYFSFRPNPDLAFFLRTIKNNKKLKVYKANIDSIKKYDVIIFSSPFYSEKYLEIEKIIDNKIPLVYLIDNIDVKLLKHLNIYKEKNFGGISIKQKLELNKKFNLFNIDNFNISLEDAPLLFSSLVEIQTFENNVLFYGSYNKINHKQPTMFFDLTSNKKLFILAGGFNYLSRFLKLKNNDIDKLIDKSILYITNIKKPRIDIDYKKIYLKNKSVVIKSFLYNENQKLAKNSELNLKVFSNNKLVKKLKFDFENDYYKVKLLNLKKGNYNFVVNTRIGNDIISKKGNFKVIDNNLEIKDVFPNKLLMENISNRNNGVFSNVNNLDKVYTKMNSIEKKHTIKEKIKLFQLIDFEWVLFIIVLLFSFELVLRKNKGHI